MIIVVSPAKQMSVRSKMGLCGRFLVLLVTLCAFTGCTTMQAVRFDDVLPSLSEKVQVGDTVRVVLKDRRVLTLRVQRVTAQFLQGSDSRGASVEIPLKNIDTLEREEISYVKTLGLGLGLIAAILGALSLAVRSQGI